MTGSSFQCGAPGRCPAFRVIALWIGIATMASECLATVVLGPRLRTTQVRIGHTEGIIITEEAPQSSTESLCRVTTWTPTVAEVRRAENHLTPKLLSRFNTFHPERRGELRFAKRQYLGITVKGARILLVVGYRPNGPAVSSGQWSRPIIHTDLPGDWGYTMANLLFMAWLSCEPGRCAVERLWPEGKAWEYDAITKLMPALDAEILRVAKEAADRDSRPHTCRQPSREIKVNSHDEYTEAVYYGCSIQPPFDGPHREELNVYATGTIRRHGSKWRITGSSAHTFLAHTH